MSLDGRYAFVSGGSGHIGGAICRTLAAAGGRVVVHAHSGRERAEAVVAEIRGAGGSAEAVAFDVTDDAAAKAALATLTTEAPFQIVVHAAGFSDDAPLAGMTAERWRSVVDVSLNGFFNVVQPLLLPMLRTRWGRVVAISSLSGVMGNRGQANYAAAKAGLHGAVKSLSLEYASRGITANAIAPGIIATPEVLEVFPEERIAALVPMKRAGTPQEVADLAAFLASDKAAYISGQVITIGGGLG